MTGSLNMVGYGLAAIGPGVGIGLIFAAYISGVARQPEARSVLQGIAILGLRAGRGAGDHRHRPRVRALASCPAWIASAMALLAAAAEAEEPSPLMPHLSELIVGLVAFALLFFFLRAKVFPIFEKTYAERTARHRGRHEAGRGGTGGGPAGARAVPRQLADARGEAARIREEARTQGAAILAEMRDNAQAEAERITARAHAQIAAEREQVVQVVARPRWVHSPPSWPAGSWASRSRTTRARSGWWSGSWRSSRPARRRHQPGPAGRREA